MKVHRLTVFFFFFSFFFFFLFNCFSPKQKKKKTIETCSFYGHESELIDKVLLCDRKIVMNRDYSVPLFTFQTFLSQYSSVAKYRKNERKIYMNFISFEELIVLLRTIAVYYPKFEFFLFLFFFLLSFV